MSKADAVAFALSLSPLTKPTKPPLPRISRRRPRTTLRACQNPSLPRRDFLVSSALFAASALTPRSATAASLDGPELRGLGEPPREGEPTFQRLEDGLRVQDIAIGRDDGEAVRAGATVSLKYVLRRSNGYLIYASEGGYTPAQQDLAAVQTSSFTFTVGRGEVVPGFERAVLGLRPGGRRRFLVPPGLGYAQTGTKPGASPGPLPPDWGARRSLASHSSEPLLFEVFVTRVKV